MRSVAVTGASGFLGSHYVKYSEAHQPDWRLIAQVRSTPLGFTGPRIRALPCDLTRPEAVEILAGSEADVIVHMAAAITDEDPRRINAAMMTTVLEACRRLGARLLYVSSSQVHFTGLNQYALSKIDDEKAARLSGVPHVILRPAAPCGPLLPDHTPARKQPMHQLVGLIRKLPVVPVIGDGEYTRQPVYVDDVSQAINHLIEKDGFDGRSFDIGGPRTHRLNQIIDILAKIAGKQVVKLHLPKRLFLLASHLVPTLNPDLLSTVDSDERVDNRAILEELGRDGFVPFETSARTLF